MSLKDIKEVAVDRNTHTVDRYYFDLYVTETGFGGKFIWKIPAYRFIHSRLVDFLKRNKYKNLSPTEINKLDERSFFIEYEDIQGIVNDDSHKEFQIQTSSELMRILFRKVNNYDEFLSRMSSKIADKIHSRTVEVKPSLEQGY